MGRILLSIEESRNVEQSPRLHIHFVKIEAVRVALSRYRFNNSLSISQVSFPSFVPILCYIRLSQPNGSLGRTQKLEVARKRV